MNVLMIVSLLWVSAASGALVWVAAALLAAFPWLAGVVSRLMYSTRYPHRGWWRVPPSDAQRFIFRARFVPSLFRRDGVPVILRQRKDVVGTLMASFQSGKRQVIGE